MLMRLNSYWLALHQGNLHLPFTAFKGVWGFEKV
jgi:hypothetical protein